MEDLINLGPKAEPLMTVEEISEDAQGFHLVIKGNGRVRCVNIWEAAQIARQQSLLSNCRRSKRGVVIWRGNEVVGAGFNYRHGGGCDGSDACKATCGRVCIHAEQRALLGAGAAANGAMLLHVKTVEGKVVASGGPSCLECSKLIAMAGLSEVWLVHSDGARLYYAEEFHKETLKGLGLK